MQKHRVETTDILIIGAGITGLRAAVEASDHGEKVLVVAKGPRCSWGIGGFNAPAATNDSVELYRQDILESGIGLNDSTLVDILAKGSMAEAVKLEEHGMVFDHKEDGSYDLLRPLGCSVPRLLHNSNKTGTLAENIFLDILKKRDVEVRDGVHVLELLVKDNRIYGAIGVEADGCIVCYKAKAVVMAAGGCGHMYPMSTYPDGIQGDSYGMLLRAGCEMIDMEFMQFEPCCLLEPESLRGRGISTTMLSDGAKLKNANGEEFLDKYFSDFSKVQKGELSRAIYSEIENCGGEAVLYDMTPLSADAFKAHCIYAEKLRSEGYDSTLKPMRIMPAAHTFLGGARINSSCETSIEGLFAGGEAIGGLHGANRIGGCAGAETFVFGAVAGNNALAYAASHDADFEEADKLIESTLNSFSLTPAQADYSHAELKAELQQIMVENLFITRDERGLNSACSRAKEIFEQAAGLPRETVSEILEANEIENIGILVWAIAESSLCRRESRGVFYRSDYPYLDNEKYKVNTLLRYNNKNFVLRKRGDLNDIP